MPASASFRNYQITQSHQPFLAIERYIKIWRFFYPLTVNNTKNSTGTSLLKTSLFLLILVSWLVITHGRKYRIPILFYSNPGSEWCPMRWIKDSNIRSITYADPNQYLSFDFTGKKSICYFSYNHRPFMILSRPKGLRVTLLTQEVPAGTAMSSRTK